MPSPDITALTFTAKPETVQKPLVIATGSARTSAAAAKRHSSARHGSAASRVRREFITTPPDHSRESETTPREHLTNIF
jgi:hypothetical protein